MTSIAYYVTRHGFGHATRSAEVIFQLNRLAPAIKILVRSNADASIFHDAGCSNFSVLPCGLDVGVVQKDGLTMDIPATLNALIDLYRLIPNKINQEIAFGREQDFAAVISDVPSAAFVIAERLGIPSFAISNFSWDWIYEPWVLEYSGFGEIVDAMRREYGRATELLQLPFSDDLPAFQRVKKIPIIGRKAQVERDVVRSRLGIYQDKPLVLLSFGGMGLKTASLDRLENIERYQFLATDLESIPGIKTVGPRSLQKKHLRYPDLVGAADIVITKPGYGIVSECATNMTKMLYTERGPFREYDVIVREMQKILAVEYIPGEDFRSGAWESYLDALLVKSHPQTQISSNGAKIAAERILDVIQFERSA